jgi:hypothetical protein
LEGLERCPKCQHPADEDKLVTLCQRHDATRPSNQRAIRGLERGWQNGLLWERIESWKLFATVLPVWLAGTCATLLIAAEIGIPLWILTGCAAASPAVIFPFLMSRLRRGEFRWLLRKETRSVTRSTTS